MTYLYVGLGAFALLPVLRFLLRRAFSVLVERRIATYQNDLENFNKINSVTSREPSEEIGRQERGEGSRDETKQSFGGAGTTFA